ncbi:MAG: hypothetical protein DI527_00655 [Chelatococcus sp.]|nr:MAG: hypothetical protein DI527_00655 [Chelatococcus sp.]
MRIAGEALNAAVLAYDEARRAAHGPNEPAMSARNRETIAPMIAAAIAAYRARQGGDVPADAVLRAALAPLVRIADAFDANELDDEARKSWGLNGEFTALSQRTPDEIQLYTGRGGRELLTLADCFAARGAVRLSDDRPSLPEPSCAEMLAEAKRLASEVGYVVVPDPIHADGEVHAPDLVIQMQPSLHALGFKVVPIVDHRAPGREEIGEAIAQALEAELGDAYDCRRVWEAWHVGTMSEDDFIPITDRLGEIAKSVREKIEAILATSAVQQDDLTEEWRRLVLQFDRHRIAALALIRAAAAGKATAEDCASFIALPPPDTVVAVQPPYWTVYREDQTFSISVVFEGGHLMIRAKGHGERNGSGEFVFRDDDLEWGTEWELVAFDFATGRAISTRPAPHTGHGTRSAPRTMGGSHCDRNRHRRRNGLDEDRGGALHALLPRPGDNTVCLGAVRSRDQGNCGTVPPLPCCDGQLRRLTR